MDVEKKQARILVVSASPYTRYVISGELSSASDLFVVGTARTPDEVAYKRTLLKPDVAVVDLESARDLADLKQTMMEEPLPVLALCPHAEEGAELAFAALESGASEVMPKPNGNLGVINFSSDLLRKVRGLARVKPSLKTWRWPDSTSPLQASPRSFFPGDRLVVVSAATGAIEPLIQLLTGLPADLDAGILIVSQLPSRYLYWFLRRVQSSASFSLEQAQDGSALKCGAAYFAPQDFHLTVGTRGALSLDRGPHCNGMRPSADVTLSSLATQYGPAVIGVILSGVGRDGVQGARDVFAAGGIIIVQETASCLADETPAAVIDSGAATSILPPERIADEVIARARKKA